LTLIVTSERAKKEKKRRNGWGTNGYDREKGKEGKRKSSVQTIHRRIKKKKRGIKEEEEIRERKMMTAVNELLMWAGYG